MATRTEYAARPNRESLRKRLGTRVARAIDARDGGRCCYCHRDAVESGAHMHLDHLVPRSHGGADVPANLATACRRCNSARQNMSLVQWAAYAAEKLGLAIDPEAIVAHAAQLAA